MQGHFTYWLVKEKQVNISLWGQVLLECDNVLCDLQKVLEVFEIYLEVASINGE